MRTGLSFIFYDMAHFSGHHSCGIEPGAWWYRVPNRTNGSLCQPSYDALHIIPFISCPLVVLMFCNYFSSFSLRPANLFFYISRVRKISLIKVSSSPIKDPQLKQTFYKNRLDPNHLNLVEGRGIRGGTKFQQGKILYCTHKNLWCMCRSDISIRRSDFAGFIIQTHCLVLSLCQRVTVWQWRLQFTILGPTLGKLADHSKLVSCLLTELASWFTVPLLAREYGFRVVSSQLLVVGTFPLEFAIQL